MGRRLTIDPVTRLEGHGRIVVDMDSAGQVEKARVLLPELRAFEKLCEGRAVEEMPTLTAKICGICPTAHHVAAAEALDRVYGVRSPPAARRIRELLHTAFLLQDHLLHFFVLSLADFLPETVGDRTLRNLVGVLRTLGAESGGNLLEVRRQVRELEGMLSGSALYPACCVPGGVTTQLGEEQRGRMLAVADRALGFARDCLEMFHARLLVPGPYRDALDDPTLAHPTHYLGMVDAQGRLCLYDGQLRVVDPAGRELAKFSPEQYPEHLAERVEPDTFGKVVYLRQVGWHGYRAGADSGIYRVAPLARLNVCDGLATPLAQTEFERYCAYLGGRPVHQTMAYHWARLIEVLFAAERIGELVRDPQLFDPETRVIPTATPGEGVAACEAPRGTLIHHYRSDQAGLVEWANLIVGTQNNYAAINLSVEAAARRHLLSPEPPEPALNRVEVALRAYDPCFSCTTHALSSGDGGSIRIRVGAPQRRGRT